MTTLTQKQRNRMVPADLQLSTSVESGLPWNWNRIKPTRSPACPIQSKDQRTSIGFFVNKYRNSIATMTSFRLHRCCFGEREACYSKQSFESTRRASWLCGN